MISMPTTQDPPSLRDRILTFDHAMNAEEVAALLGMNQNTIRKQARSGDIPSFRVGTAIRFDPKELADWFTKH